jgi:hypothetical protein
VIDRAEMKATNLRKLKPAYDRYRYSILFYSLLLTLAAVPVLNAFHSSGLMIDSLLAANLIAAIMPVHNGKNRHILLAILMILWITRPLAFWLQHQTLSVVVLVIWTLIGLLAAASALQYAFRARTIDGERVYAALSAYLLAGLFFGIFYWALNQFKPGAFNISGELSRTTAIYFSFVTLATLGYGDIVPRTDVARGLAVIEAVGGQLFLAVLVARLVSLYTRDAEK